MATPGMRPLRSFGVLVVSSLISACGGTSQRVERPGGPGSVRTIREMPQGRSVEEATGDVREAILALRRVHFALDSYSLSAETRSALADASEILRERSGIALYIEGHADERGTAEYNIALGERRGRAVADHLVRLGIAADRLSVVSYGEEAPLVAGSDQRAWAANRRVDFRLMRGEARLEVSDTALVSDRGRPLR